MYLAVRIRAVPPPLSATEPPTSNIYSPDVLHLAELERPRKFSVPETLMCAHLQIYAANREHISVSQYRVCACEPPAPHTNAPADLG